MASWKSGQTFPLSESGTRHSTSRLTCLTAFDSRKNPAVRNSQRRNNNEQIGCTRIKHGYAVYFFQRMRGGAQIRSVRELNAGRLTCPVPRSHRNARACSFAARLAQSSAIRRQETRSGQGALARRHTDGPLRAALLKTTVRWSEGWFPIADPLPLFFSLF